MRKAFYTILGFVSGLVALLSLPHLFMATHDLLDARHAQLLADILKWDPYTAVQLIGPFCFGAFFMTFGLLGDAFTAKTTANCQTRTDAP